MNKIITFMRESSTARFLIPFGIVLIVFGVIIFVINSKNQNFIKTEAIVTNVQLSQEEYLDADGSRVEATYNVTIKYTVDEIDYEETVENISKYEVNDKMTIYYNPQDPSQITQSISLILPIAIMASGVAALVGGIVSAVNAVKRHKAMKEQERSWENGQ